MEFFTRVATTYGGVARIRFGRNNYSYLVSEPELLKELLIENRSNYMKNVRYPLLSRVLGKGILLSEGESWSRQRKILQPIFRLETLQQQVDRASVDVAKFLDRFEAACDSGLAFDIEPEFSRLAQLLAGAWVMGDPFRKRAEKLAEIYRNATEAWPEAPKGALGSYRIPSFRKIRSLKQAFAAFEEGIFEIIAEFRQGGPQEMGLMPFLVEGHAKATGRALSDRELRDQIVTLFIAAHETSGSGLCWIHYFLSKHPDVRARVQSEIAEVYGAGKPGGEALSNLAYLERVIKEALRVYSPIHSLSRIALVDNKIGGYTIPKGSTVIVSLYATHRLPRYWPNPEAFDPERFTDEENAKRPPFSYIPFAAGHRNCIGGTMAMLQSSMIVAQISQRYNFDLIEGHPIELMPSTTLRPRYGMQVRVSRSGGNCTSLEGKKIANMDRHLP